MKHKRLLLILGCLMSVLLAGYVTLRLSAPRHRITADNIQAIRAGMTAKEVEEILGAPPGYYCSRKDEEVIAVIAPAVWKLLPQRWNSKEQATASSG